jgi:KDO2-lipid IV(A) lauroyltransferase
MTFQGLVLSGFLRLVSVLPLRLIVATGAALGSLLYRIPNRNLRLARRNIEMCFPELEPDRRELLARDSMRSMVQTFLEFSWFWYRKPERLFGLIRKIHGLELFEQACATGQGVLLAAPHLGCWELMGQYLPSQIETVIMYKRPDDPGVEQVIIRGRQRTGVKLIPADGKGVRQVFQAIRNGQLVGILPDQQAKAGQGQFAPFFGIEALTMVLLSKLAQKTDCTVLFAWTERLPGGAGYDFHFSAAPEQISDPDLRISVTALNQGVEQCVRQCPAQYQWSYKRFGIRPEGEPPLY